MPALPSPYLLGMEKLASRSLVRRSGPPLAVKVAVPIVGVIALILCAYIIYKVFTADRNLADEGNNRKPKRKENANKNAALATDSASELPPYTGYANDEQDKSSPNYQEVVRQK